MAASKDFAVLNLENGSQDLGDMDLQFQDFGDTRTQSAVGGGGGQQEHTITFTDFPDSAQDEMEQEKLMGEGEEEEATRLKAGASFWTFEFYQQFFDVESKQVGDRILWSMVPKPGVSYLQSYIRPNPDLYGPFWICITLAFTTAITGNLANYLATPPEDTYVWRYEFRKVTLAASAIFAYAWLVPLGVWGLVVWRGSRAKISLLELLCIYGYSLAIFVPVSILWMVPQPWFKWCLAVVAPVLSGTVLVRTVWPSLSHDTRHLALGIGAFILLLHATLALGFMLYFFSAPEKTSQSFNIPPNVNPAIVPSSAPVPSNHSTKEAAALAQDAKNKEDKEKSGGEEGGGESGGKDIGKGGGNVEGKKDVAPESISPKSVREVKQSEAQKVVKEEEDTDKVKKLDTPKAKVDESQKSTDMAKKETDPPKTTPQKDTAKTSTSNTAKKNTDRE